jgi:hypothetical protein
MEQNLSYETNSCLGSQQIPHLLWNLKVCDHVHQTLSLVPVLSQINPIKTLPPNFLTSILILSYHVCLGLLSGLSLQTSQTKFYMHFSSPQHVKHALLISLFYFIILMIFGEKWKLWSSSLCSLFRSLLSLHPC